MMHFRSKALIALGGNATSSIGGPERILAAAIRDLSRTGLTIRAISRFFATPCFPAGAGPDFVNAVIEVQTDLAADLVADQVLTTLHEVEARFGRQRRVRWGQRTLDLDLLAIGDAVLPDRDGFDRWRRLPPAQQAETAPDRLILPHPRLQDRAFVLVPLCDVAPGWRHPVLGLTARDLMRALPPAEIHAVRPL